MEEMGQWPTRLRSPQLIAMVAETFHESLDLLEGSYLCSLKATSVTEVRVRCRQLSCFFRHDAQIAITHHAELRPGSRGIGFASMAFGPYGIDRCFYSRPSHLSLHCGQTYSTVERIVENYPKKMPAIRNLACHRPFHLGV